MVSALDFGASGPVSSPGGDIVLFCWARHLRVSVSKNQTKSEISGKNVKIQICSNSSY